MHKGEYRGIEADSQKRKILILGESHHIDNEEENSQNKESGIEATYTTDRVVKGYLADKDRKNRNLYFFHKIAKSFGIDTTLDIEQKIFWEKVYFGNYIDVLCGVGDCFAENLLNDDCKREYYNDELFQFVRNNEIDIICCFSRRVYSKLPSLTDISEELDSIGNMWLYSKDGKKKTDKIDRCIYLPQFSHEHTSESLTKPLLVYGMLHPSGQYGFNPKNYANTLSKLIDF